MQAGDFISINDVTRIVLADVKDILCMSDLYKLCKVHGFNRLEIQYVGGSWVWIEFDTTEACSSLKKHEGIKSVFKEVKPVSKTSVVRERMVWLEVQGFPLCAWTSTTFKKVASLYGKVMFLDDDLEEQKSCGRVCVNSMHTSYIWDTVVVSIDGKDFSITVREISYWTLTFNKMDEESEDGYEAESQNYEDEPEGEKQNDEDEGDNDSEEIDEEIQVEENITDTYEQNGKEEYSREGEKGEEYMKGRGRIMLTMIMGRKRIMILIGTMKSIHDNLRIRR